MASKMVDYKDSPYGSDEQHGVGNSSNLADTLGVVRHKMTESYKHMITHWLHMLMFTCVQVYNDVVVVFMHEVVVCVVDKVMHWWLSPS